MARWPLYPVTVVGSWPRPAWLLDAMKKKRTDLRQLQDDATLLAIKLQEDAGVDIVSDGEQRRDNFYSFICERLDGIRLMTMADLLEYVEDKAAFENLLSALDVPAFAIKNPTVVGKLSRRAPLVLDDYHFLRAHTKKPVKVTLPGPYLLSRSSWVKNLSEAAYPTRELLADDVVGILRDEIRELAAAGADVVQLDEPVLSELVFAGKSATRTFMCAALAASASPEKELDFAVDLVNRVVDGIDGPVLALHVCRGNWSQKEDVLLQGSYDALIPHFRRMRVQQFVLEYATPRAGSLEALRDLPAGALVGFGAVNPRTTEIEPPAEIAARVRRLAGIISPERIHLNPDCGFGTFADRPVATADVASAKLQALAAAATVLRA
ncbi:MAG: cobalamin-independent methionine synthase II family protein [Planctomycetes bacterium]|nr:cobalamin-independent methionine synthase II family protein [Planctomycetota bacterium]MBI3845332.1 cobalamin-independent methionine synthase II family protein [Planctomycetota bacterium]